MKRTLLHLMIALLLLIAAPAQSPAATIDVLVVYTAAARDYVGGDAAMNDTINNLISEGNIIFTNSQIDHRLRLVEQRLLPGFTETTSTRDDLSSVHARTDVQAWRDEFGADVVSMLGNYDWILVGQGTGFLGSWDTPTQTMGYGLGGPYSLASISAPYPGIVFIHEIAHNFGCQHNSGAAAPPLLPAIEDYALGYLYWVTDWIGAGWRRTIMAYPTVLKPALYPVWYFSNPNTYHWDIFLGPVPMGTAATNNNAKVIQDYGPYVAKLRDAVLPSGTWVDNAYSGTELGTPEAPYNTVQEGIDNVPTGGNLIFKAGSENWTGTISKAMTMISYGGVMVIGQ